MWRAWNAGRPALQNVRRSVIRRSTSDSTKGSGRSKTDKRVTSAANSLLSKSSSRGFAETTNIRPQLATAAVQNSLPKVCMIE